MSDRTIGHAQMCITMKVLHLTTNHYGEVKCLLALYIHTNKDVLKPMSLFSFWPPLLHINAIKIPSSWDLRTHGPSSVSPLTSHL